MHRSKYLRSKVLKSIKRWIKKVKKHNFKSKYRGDTKARKILKLRFKKGGYGYNRIVYAMDKDLVLKVAVTKRGIENNKNEARIYRKAPAGIKKYLAQVKAHGYGWIIMKRIQKKVPWVKGYKSKVLQLQRMFARKGIKSNDIFHRNGKVNKSNLRFSRGHIVVIDYGEFEKVKTKK